MNKHYERTALGTNMLTRYAVEGTKLMEEPEFKSMIEHYKRQGPTTKTDEEIFESLMKTLAQVQGHARS